ncbi:MULTISPECIES: FAD-dependent monooxygenase [unclassified Streptomyces]|uniref:FAD-dependent monooxygenase n=1 Tax=unclassified Streptomyces TaxID=2593676 RepID=UPI002DD9461B|nr:MULTISPECIES: FAD-dependent monooxygenase [unclassified Streptomyces]WSA90491.1 FAD-dependent monooxygenase [Streptomyces sp. NBC_01795]WSB74816.1 FAD-dependent monooxygenase [Streptomyces sp. NBC_01775]WSS16901.1 FAD-dependent monooxygenase [Streptomyces sp. NBC_01186]WSS45644.1 FAD-dependent monooxygenase [Streptomyces sp. NBC_01187]
MSSEETTDVLVIGAGPAGLTLANYLSLQGVSVRLLERAPGPPERLSSSVHGPGSEVMQRMGSLGNLPNETPMLTNATAHLGRQPIRLRYTTPGKVNLAPPMLINQGKIEAALREYWADRDGAVEWNSVLVDIEQDADRVTAVLSNGERVHASWLVGCDGPDSMVRKAAGISSIGRSSRYLMVDAHVNWDLDRNGLTGWLHPDGKIGAMPMVDPDGRNNLWRILALDPEQGTEKPDEDEIVSRVRTVLAERSPYGGVEFLDTTTKLTFVGQGRIVENYREGRVLVAGDAAHPHVPFGGPAIHTGMGDSENLAWKLALVIGGKAGEALLETYQGERRPIAEEIVLGKSAPSQIEKMRNPVVRVLRDHVVAPIVKTPGFDQLTTFSHAKLWETYRTGPLGGGARFAAKPRPGDTVGDLECVHSADRRRTRLYEQFHGRWVLLVPRGGADPCVDVVRQHLDDDQFVVLERKGAQSSGKKDQAAAREVWLIRPDGHLAWRGEPESPGLDEWLEGMLRYGRTNK